jgi:putative beta-barrel porin BBP2
MKTAIHFAALVLLLVTCARAASAQDRSTPLDPADSARFQWGILRFTPGIAVSNIGVDSNVFNTTDDPKRDNTAAVGPAVNLWMNLGPAKLTGKSAGQYLYFKTYNNQRAWNTDDQLRVELPLARLRPFIFGSYLNTRERPGYEIDARARLATNTMAMGTDLKLSGKTTFVFSGTRTIIAFDQHDSFGAALAQSLNRTSDTERLQFRYALTPLTTLVVNNDAIQDRFEFEPARDSDSIRVMPGFEFKPLALISGSVLVGFRHFNALNSAIPDFNGVAATADAKYTVGTTQIQTKVSRDLNFSYEALNAYYALTDVTLTVTERITRTWDVVGRVGWQSLDYSESEAQTAPAGTSVSPSENGRQYGFGIGYRLGESVRVGFDVNYLMRRSAATLRDYQGLRAGASVSYGLPQ